MNGKALNAEEKEFPTMAEVLNKIPKHCFVKDTAKSLMYAAVSTAITVGLGLAAFSYIPMQMAYLPAWIAYAFVAGTASTGCWVVAHECGHGAFSDNRVVQDTVGYILHSLLLVPYNGVSVQELVIRPRWTKFDSWSTDFIMPGHRQVETLFRQLDLVPRVGERR